MIIVDEKRRSMGSVPPLMVHIQHKAEGGEIDGEGMEDYHVLAAEALEAIEAKDPHALADALYAFFQKCDMEMDHDEEEGE